VDPLLASGCNRCILRGGARGRSTAPRSRRDGTLRRARIGLPLLLALIPLAAPAPAATPEAHVACRMRDPLRRAHFGALHVHTALSFDAWTLDVRALPEDAYRYARGGSIALPPLDAGGRPTRVVKIGRPLDFVAVTDHAELLGERELCADPSGLGGDAKLCRQYRGEIPVDFEGPPEYQPVARLLDWLRFVAEPGISRDAELCGADGSRCRDAARGPWREIRASAERNYDRSADCRFTTFVAYEYTATPNYSNLHRNVIFANESVPELPTSSLEARTPQELWRRLRAECIDAGTGCDALAIPHNSNLSNGRMFAVEYPGAEGPAARAAAARERSRIEPLVEIFQHKGDSECRAQMPGVLGGADELCDFEKWRPAAEDCGSGTGQGALPFRRGCESSRDFVRGALLEGVREQRRSAANPFRLGIVAATDTHNGLAGGVDERSFPGHGGSGDATPERRLAAASSNPGGIAGVFAEQNTRESLFVALRRRETFGTSGPRITPRFFGGWGYAEGLCNEPGFVAAGYAGGVPMGGVLPARPGAAKAPVFAVSALRDAGSADAPGTPLQRIQIVKGWVDATGAVHQLVVDVAGGANSADVDLASCTPRGPGHESLCGVWRDPDFDPAAPAFWYARVLENPSCRWSTWQCNALPAENRPPACSDPAVAKTIQERAWTSPIWYEPARR